MYKFTFNNEEKIKPRKAIREMVTSVEAEEHSELKKQEKIKNNEYKNEAVTRLAELDSPFALFTGDPSYNAITNPDAEKPSFEFIHKSIDAYSGESKRGVPYARHLKMLLREPRSGYQRIELQPSHYEAFLNPNQKRIIQEHFEKTRSGDKIAPILEAYVPVEFGNAATSAVSKFNRVVKRSSASRFVRIAAVEETRELEPDDPITILNTSKNPISDMFNFDAPATEVSGENNCVTCGRPDSEHTDAKSARSLFKSKGESLENHPFWPSTKVGTLSSALSQSSLLKFVRPVEDPINKKTTMQVAGAYDKDDGRPGNFVPMVRIGDKPIKLIRSIGREVKKRMVSNSLYRDGIQHCPSCLGTGKRNSNQRDYSVRCNDCLDPNNIVSFKTTKDSDGNDKLEPLLVSIGNGKVKYANPLDAPECKICDHGEISNGKRTMKCTTCDGTGHDNTATPCPNHDLTDSRIGLTPNNVCQTCKGRKIIEKPTDLQRKGPSAKVTEDSPEGNIHYAVPMNENIIWKGHANPDCHVCNGNDEYQTKYGLPCNCRIAGPDDQIALPSHIKVIKRNKINIPTMHYQELMKRAYGDTLEGGTIGPHRMIHQVFNKGYLKNKIGVNWLDSEASDPNASMFGERTDQVTGLTTPGKRIPKQVIKMLKEKSKKNHSSVNAQFCAASADLEDTLGEMYENFHTYPDAIRPRGTAKKRTGAERDIARVDLDSFPESIRPSIANVERMVQSLPDAWNGRYNRLSDTLYHHAAMVSAPNAPADHPSYKHFKKAKDRLISAITRSNGSSSIGEIEPQVSSLIPMPALANGKTTPNIEQETTNV